MFDIIARVLAWYYSIWPSYGMAIVFLTLTVMILVLPLTLKATRSMLMMQALQPEIKKLQAEHRDDRQKLNEEMLALYRQNKINPLSGCLPLLIQLPVFIVLYQVLQGLTRKGEDGTFDPKYINPDTALYQALDGSTEMVSWGIDLAQSATRVAAESFVAAIPYILLILAVAATTYVQQKQISARNPNSNTLSNPQQKLLLRILPAFMAFISLGLPAALVVYFLVSNLFRVGQQALISHAIYKPAVRDGLVPPKADTTADAADTGKKPAKPPVGDKVIDTTARPAKTQSGKTQSGRTQSGRTQPGKTSTARSPSTSRNQTGKSASARTSSGRAQPPKPRPAKSSTAKSPPANAASAVDAAAEPARSGFLGRLRGGGNVTSGNGAEQTSKPGPSTGRSTGPPRPASGRVTPPGGKKKRK
ncbi:MAG: YidC/Oxa1 family membrane protein insertase [Acidimicrobiales bacterium]